MWLMICLLYTSVAEGNTISDFDKEEIKRKFSINTSVVPVIWGDVKLNILDTPGYFDFAGEAEEAASAADAAIIVVSGKNGVEVGTQKAWALCEKYKLPRMFYVSNMDVDNASFRQVVEDLTELYGKKIAPIHLPIRENEQFVGYVNVVKKKGRRYLAKGQKEECPIPSYSEEYLEKYRELLLEAVAETSEDFMERYFGGEEFSVPEILMALTADAVSYTHLDVYKRQTVRKEFKPPVVTATGNSEDVHDYVKVTVKDTDLCPRYCARVVKNIKIAPSPVWMQRRLAATGIRPINNIVDITNYVMEEYGCLLYTSIRDWISLICRRSVQNMRSIRA